MSVARATIANLDSAAIYRSRSRALPQRAHAVYYLVRSTIPCIDNVVMEIYSASTPATCTFIL